MQTTCLAVLSGVASVIGLPVRALAVVMLTLPATLPLEVWQPPRNMPIALRVD